MTCKNEFIAGTTGPTKGITMDISTASIETAISAYTKGLDAERQKLRDLASGAIAVREPQHAIEQAQVEVTRIQGVLQGLTFALGEIQAQQQGFATLEAARNTVLTLDAETLEEIRVERSIAEHDLQMDAEHA